MLGVLTTAWCPALGLRRPPASSKPAVRRCARKRLQACRGLTKSSSMAIAHKRTCEADGLPSTPVRGMTGRFASRPSPMSSRPSCSSCRMPCRHRKTNSPHTGGRSGSERSSISAAGGSNSSVMSEARPFITWASCRLSRRQFTGSRSRSEGGEGTRLWVDDLAGLLGLVEIGRRDARLERTCR
jgi:hypothetical protein